MKVTVTTLSGEMFPLDVNEEIELENFKALCEFESGIPSHEITILWNGMPLHDNAKTLKQYGLKENEVLLLQHMRGSQRMLTGAQGGSASGATGGIPLIDFSNIPLPGGTQGQASSSSMPFPAPLMGNTQAAQRRMLEDPAAVREILLQSPRELSLIKERNPELAESLLSGSLEKFTTVFRRQQQERQEVERKKQKLLSADPFDAEAQKLIAEEIRLKNVESNMETAMEYSPESFGQVVMLYIDCTVNGHPVKAFVDSGAQMTIMSQRCAERCNIMRLVDTRWAGLAKGVGTQKIIGRVHLGQIQIGKDYLQSSFSILEDQPMDMLLGLDMLKRHQCCIDLKRNMLVIATTGAETPFLSESELPEHARLNAPALGRSKSEVEQEDHQLAEALAKSAQEASSPPGSQQSTSSNQNTAGEQSASAASSAALPTYPESTISRLMSYGYGREQVIEELRTANGNADQALVALLAKSLP